MNDEQLNELGKHLNDISNVLLYQIRAQGIEKVLDYSTEHFYRENWKRISIRKEFLEPWRDVLDVDAMAVEVIITSDKETEIHYHKNAYAVVTILGKREGVTDPDHCVYYFDSKEAAHQAVPGITLQILPSLVHGFCSDGVHPISFLSVQSKKINEDFHPV
jgi:hypothetical protein